MNDLFTSTAVKQLALLILKTKIVKFTNSMDVKTLQDLKHGLDELIKLIEIYRD